MTGAARSLRRGTGAAAFHFDLRAARWWGSLRQAALHAAITLLALGIAFALPAIAQHALYQWWPIVASNANLLLALEITLAALLVLLFNSWRVAVANREKGKVADTASLVYARHRASWLTRLRERSLIRKRPAARDAFILTLTGYDTLADEASPLRDALQSAHNVHVMLLHPAAHGAERRVSSLPGEITQQTYAEEVEASITYLATLRAQGKKVTLKFYEDEPFWKVVVLGDHLWVQYCQRGFEVRDQPEYVFALNRDNPRLGLFVPFYVHFVEQWNDARHPRFDFDTRDLVYSDAHGREARRARFASVRADTPALLQPALATSRQMSAAGAGTTID